MSIPFSYEIIKVDPAAKAMEIVYTAAGRAPVHMGARLPYVGETLESVVQTFAPVAHWLEQDRATVDVAVGTTGQLGQPQPVTLASAKADKLAEIAAWRYRREVGGVSFNGVRVATDRESQAQLTGAYTSLVNGLVQSVDWKAANGQFVTLTLAEVRAIAGAVVAHVQSCFTAEKGYAQQVAAATTIEAVAAIALPADTIPVAIP